MAKKQLRSARRKPRTDAQRNRERILEVAKEMFARSGANSTLDEIATQAGVGAGTLYRHFPTRDALLEAVYRTEVEKLASAERTLAQTLAPVEALRAWMSLFVDYICNETDHRTRIEYAGRSPLKGVRSFSRPDQGSD
jgi:AcrR family transcriptional regulator